MPWKSAGGNSVKMESKIVTFVKGEWMPTIQEVDKMFTSELEKLREAEKDLGKYLIGVTNKPWKVMKFIIGSRQDYDTYQRNLNEIIIGETI